MHHVASRSEKIFQIVELEFGLLLHGIQKLSFRSRVIMDEKRHKSGIGCTFSPSCFPIIVTQYRIAKVRKRTYDRHPYVSFVEILMSRTP